MKLGELEYGRVGRGWVGLEYDWVGLGWSMVRLEWVGGGVTYDWVGLENDWVGDWLAWAQRMSASVQLVHLKYHLRDVDSSPLCLLWISLNGVKTDIQQDKYQFCSKSLLLEIPSCFYSLIFLFYSPG